MVCTTKNVNLKNTMNLRQADIKVPYKNTFFSVITTVSVRF